MTNWARVFLAAEAEAGSAPLTVGRRLAAIGWMHRRAGLPPPQKIQGAAAILEVIAGIRHAATASPRSKSTPPTPTYCATCCAPCRATICARCATGRCWRSAWPARSGGPNYKSMQVLADYVRDAELFRDHAGEGFL